MFYLSVELFYFTIYFEFSMNCLVHYSCLKSYNFTPSFFSSYLLFLSSSFLFFSYLLLLSSSLHTSSPLFSFILFSVLISFFLYLLFLFKGMAAAVVMSSVLGMIFYCIAFLVNDVKRSEAKVDKKALIRIEYLKYKEEHQNHLHSTSKDSIT